MKIILFLVTISLLSSCATHDSEMQSARMVQEDKFTFTFAHQYLLEADNDIWNKIKKNDSSTDYNAMSVATGLSFLMRRGLTSYMDLGFNTSLGNSSLEPRFTVYNGKRYASALGTKFVFPTFALDVPTLYRYKVVWYNSYELLPNFTVYAAPHIEVKPFGGEKKQYRGISTGMIIGKDSGIVAEATYARATTGDDPKSLQQFMLGYTTGLDKLVGRLQYDPLSKNIRLMPSFGMSVFPTPSLGLIGRYLSNVLDYELGIDFGIGPIPNIEETKVGVLNTRFFALRALYEFRKDHFFKFGLARKEVRGDFDSNRGWESLYVVNHGIDLSWEQSFGEWSFTWIGIYLPILFLPHSLHSDFANLGVRYERLPSFSFVNVHKEF